MKCVFVLISQSALIYWDNKFAKKSVDQYTEKVQWSRLHCLGQATILETAQIESYFTMICNGFSYDKVINWYHLLPRLLLYSEGCNCSRWLVGFIPLGRRARVTIPVKWLEPTYYLIIRVSVGGTFWLLVPCMRKVHTRPALNWTAVSSITKFRSHQQALGNLTNAWTPVGLSREHVVQVV